MSLRPDRVTGIAPPRDARHPEDPSMGSRFEEALRVHERHREAAAADTALPVVASMPAPAPLRASSTGSMDDDANPGASATALPSGEGRAHPAPAPFAPGPTGPTTEAAPRTLPVAEAALWRLRATAPRDAGQPLRIALDARETGIAGLSLALHNGVAASLGVLARPGAQAALAGHLDGLRTRLSARGLRLDGIDVSHDGLDDENQT